MAKSGTLRHPKNLELADRLKVAPWASLGLLEALWTFTAWYAPLGDIGGYSAEVVADGVCWRGRPSKLLEHLLETGWLDKNNDTTSLFIHDWHDHAPDWVRRKLTRQGATHFANGEPLRFRLKSNLHDEPETEAFAPSVTRQRGARDSSVTRQHGARDSSVTRLVRAYPALPSLGKASGSPEIALAKSPSLVSPQASRRIPEVSQATFSEGTEPERRIGLRPAAKRGSETPEQRKRRQVEAEITWRERFRAKHKRAPTAEEYPASIREGL